VARVETKMLRRGLAPHTVATYIPCVRRFIAWVGKPLGAVKSTIRAAGVARARSLQGDPACQGAARSPEILSGSEVSRLLGYLPVD
jgi:hypothetical protein